MSLSKIKTTLYAEKIGTPLGAMLAIADQKTLYLLEFIDWRGLERERERLCQKIGAVLIEGRTDPIYQIEEELRLYFQGKSKEFKTAVHPLGSPFQTQVWRELQKIPLGTTRSYAAIAQAIHRPSAVRAVANANGANPLAILIPCHRVIQSNGQLGGYSGGIDKKKWLLAHEGHSIL